MRKGNLLPFGIRTPNRYASLFLIGTSSRPESSPDENGRYEPSAYRFILVGQANSEPGRIPSHADKIDCIMLSASPLLTIPATFFRATVHMQLLLGKPCPRHPLGGILFP